MTRGLTKLCCALALTVPLAGCYTMTHTVGNGGGMTSEVSHRTWWVLWGLVPINDKDSHTLAGGATDYTVETQQNVWDVVLNIFTSWLSFVSRTSTVTK